jgi:pimeloyl-ACP methyl ester carboxylesterase
MGSIPMREFSVWTGILAKVTSSPFGTGHSLIGPSREAFLAGIGRQGMRAFHAYMRSASKSRAIYEQLDSALTGPFRRLPLLTIFGERNDPLAMQPHWKQLFPDARQLVVAKGNHFPMCDDPDLVATSIREFHLDRVAPENGMKA